MKEHFLPDDLCLKAWSAAWAREVIRTRWDRVWSQAVRCRLICLARDHSVKCACGSDKAIAFSISGKWLTPDDYIVECRACHAKRKKVLKPVGRPKGSKTGSKRKSPAFPVHISYEQMCKDALDTYDTWKSK